ncbi:hypothetical protein Btru_035959 [Bulinus truncatus]|nr:hypothetical protein Btru_035959 [Bulinus truncatus]
MERRRIRRKQGNKHISLAAIKQYLLYGTYPSGSTPSDKRSVRKRAESFKIEDGELYYIVRPKRIEGEPLDQNPGASKANLRKAIIMPKNQLSIATFVHVQGGGTHMGTERTFSALSAKYYWVGMANTVRKVLKNCVVCLANRPAVAKLPPQPPPCQASCLAQVMDVETSLHSSGEVLTDKRDSFSLIECNSNKVDESPVEMKYIITAELPEPEQVDSDLDFDQETAIDDTLFNPKADFDAAHRFWQKVEIQIIGPFQHKKKSAYIIISLDCFSKWPETSRIDKINEKSVSQFCLKLIARFGIMEQLVFIENDVTRGNCVDSGGICCNLQAYNIVITKENVNPLDESWNRLVVNLQRFVTLYPNNWNDCLELCLIPLRNSLVRNKDFTPSFLLMNREPSFPESVIPGKRSIDVEVELNQEQIEHSMDTVMAHYLHCAVSDIKHIAPVINELVLEEIPDKIPVRKSVRKSKKLNVSGYDDREMDDDSGTSDHNSAVSNAIESSSKKTKNMMPVIPRKKNDTNLESVKTAEPSSKPADGGDLRAVEQSEETLDKIDLDTYYRLIIHCLKDETYPDNCSAAFKRIIKSHCANHCYENNELMVKQKGKLKKVPVRMLERLVVLKESHMINDEHLSKVKVQEMIESKNLFWKDISLDIKAFVSACPGCRHGEVRRKRRASKKFVRWYSGAEEEEDSDTESTVAGDLGKVSTDELVDYLKQGITPACLSRSELLIFRKKAKNFKLEKGTLYFLPYKRMDLKPRKVIKTDKEKLEILKKSHGGDQRLQGQLYWTRGG